MKTKSNWLRTINVLLSGLLVLLGFSACDDIINPKDMYGMPYANYKLKGKVVNKEKEPVSDIQIIVKGVLGTYQGKIDTLYTNQAGEFEYSDLYNSSNTNYWIIHLDLRDNPVIYKTDSVWVEMPELTGGSGWFLGESSKEISIELTEKKQDE